MIKVTFKLGSSNGPVVSYPANSVEFNDDGTVSLLNEAGEIIGMIQSEVWEDVWIVQEDDE